MVIRESVSKERRRRQKSSTAPPHSLSRSLRLYSTSVVMGTVDPTIVTFELCLILSVTYHFSGALALQIHSHAHTHRGPQVILQQRTTHQLAGEMKTTFFLFLTFSLFPSLPGYTVRNSPSTLPHTDTLHRLYTLLRPSLLPYFYLPRSLKVEIMKRCSRHQPTVFFLFVFLIEPIPSPSPFNLPTLLFSKLFNGVTC